MSTYIKVDTGNVPQLGRRWRGEASGAVQRILANGSVIVQRSMRKNAPVGVTQRLAGNIQRTVGNGEAKITPLSKYAEVIEKGRKPGSRMPPWKNEDFQRWVRAKLGNVSPFVVARSIARKGTQPQPFIEKTHKETEPQIQEYAARAIANVISKLEA
nr:MAG TPA: putative tail-component [Caudoviricetes sp.]